MSVGAVNKQTGDRIPTAGMPAIDDALDLTSVNPVQNAIVTAALANKQDKTDNSLQTTDKTIPGAINELKSGLTNLTDAVGWDNHYNQWDETWEVGSIDTTTGANVENSTVIRSKGYISITPNTSYYFKSPNVAVAFFYDSNKTYIAQSSANIWEVFTAPANAYYMRFRTSSDYGNTYNNNVSINYPSTITGYYAGHPVIGPAVENHESRIEAVESGLTNVTTQCATTTASITINEDLTSESWYPCVVKKRNGYCYLQGILTVKANKSIAKGDIILTINDESFRSNQNTGVAMVVGSEAVYPFLIMYNGDVKYMGSYTIQPTVAIQLNALWDARG